MKNTAISSEISLWQPGNRSPELEKVRHGWCPERIFYRNRWRRCRLLCNSCNTTRRTKALFSNVGAVKKSLAALQLECTQVLPLFWFGWVVGAWLNARNSEVKNVKCGMMDRIRVSVRHPSHASPKALARTDGWLHVYGLVKFIVSRLRLEIFRSAAQNVKLVLWVSRNTYDWKKARNVYDKKQYHSSKKNR
jgi:hypothetical protein